MQQPIRIAQIIGKGVGGGIESVVMNYYRHIDRDKIQFDFFFDEDSKTIPRDEIEKLGGRVIIIPPYQKLFKYIKTLKKIFKENKYKIVHSHINTLSIFPLYAAKKAKVPVRIAHSHSTTNKKEFKRNIFKLVLRPFSKVFATHYMCCSEHAGRWLFGNKTYDQGKVYLLNNAIDLENFKYNEKIRNKIRKELNIKEDTLVIGHVGRFMKQKNHSYIIDLFKELHTKNNNYKLLLIGEGPLKEEILEKVSNLGLKNYVIFLGQKNDVNNYYQAMDIFLFPSLYEGLGMVYVEAQVSGLASIASQEIPQVAKVSDKAYFISLDEPTKTWIDTIENLDTTNRKVDLSIIKKLGYDIKIEVKKLECMYLEISRCSYEK